jgi:serine phosphatase RsbU (regulator of sigma subunit)
MGAFQAYVKSIDEDDASAESVRRYLNWRTAHGRPEEPTDADDVDLRTYLMRLRTQGWDAESLRAHTEAIEAYYAWARDTGRIHSSPFDEYDFHRPYLSRDQIRRRQSVLGEDDEVTTEIAHLRGLYQLAAALNRAPDVHTVFARALETLAETIHLESAWAFVTKDSGLMPASTSGDVDHAFILAACRGLPPGLARQDNHFLRRSPDCHCQSLLQAEQLVRAVNIVECSRLQDSAEHDGENLGLRFHASTPILANDRLLGIINVATEEWQFLSAADLSFLSAAGVQVSAALERARMFDVSQARRGRLERELEMARTVQASLLPQQPPTIDGYEVAADWHSAFRVAGDFYDWFELPDGRWLFLIGDVTDKGAPAALYMAMVRGLLRSLAPSATEPGTLLTNVNHELFRYASTGMFVTVFCAVLDDKAGEITYANAGHNPPLLTRSDGRVEELWPTGPLLGVMESVDIATRSAKLDPNDALLVYTDGLSDALNPGGEVFDLPARAAQLTGGKGAEAALRQIIGDLQRFTAGVRQGDDITLWVLTRSQPTATDTRFE